MADGSCNGSRSGCVGDAHFAGQDDVYAAGNELLRKLDTDFERSDGFFSCHGSAVRHILCTVGDAPFDESGQVTDVFLCTHVDDEQFRADEGGESICCPPAADEIIFHHLDCGVDGVSTDGFFCDTVIRTGDDSRILWPMNMIRIRCVANGKVAKEQIF